MAPAEPGGRSVPSTTDGAGRVPPAIGRRYRTGELASAGVDPRAASWRATIRALAAPLPPPTVVRSSPGSTESTDEPNGTGPGRTLRYADEPGPVWTGGATTGAAEPTIRSRP